jgi:hypothetical protein
LARLSRNDNWKETKEKTRENDGTGEDRKKVSVKKKIPET